MGSGFVFEFAYIPYAHKNRLGNSSGELFYVKTLSYAFIVVNKVINATK